jgi:hypothetical protein
MEKNKLGIGYLLKPYEDKIMKHEVDVKKDQKWMLNTTNKIVNPGVYYIAFVFEEYT